MNKAMEEIDSFWTAKRIAEYEEAMAIIIAEVKKIDAEYERKLGKHLVRFIEKRLKTPESIRQKIERKNKSLDDGLEAALNDLAGVRIICYHTEQIEKLAARINLCTQMKTLKVKDYVKNPKKTGYQSYHMILQVGDKKVELQIRTILMDAWSSMDSVLVYKKEKELSAEMKRDIHKYAKWSQKMDALVTNLMKQ